MYRSNGPLAVEIPGSDVSECIPGVFDSRDNAYELCAAGERREIVSAAVSGLTERHALVVRLRYVLGLTFAEIAGEMGVSEPAVHSMHARALARLRESLGMMGVSACSELFL